MAAYPAAQNYRGHPGGRDREQSMYGQEPYPPCDQPMQRKEPPRVSGSLPRTISTSNMRQKIEECQATISRDYIGEPPHGGTNFFSSTPSFTLTLPSLEGRSPVFKQFVLDKLVDKTAQHHLEKDFILNWCNSTSRLLPLNTISDGNCLLHAASLGMWGFQDRSLILRRALSIALTYNNGNTLYPRWKYSREVENQQLDLELEAHQWDEEWAEVVRQASPDVQTGKNFESLDEFHVFLLANIIRRPIIMYAASKLRSLRGDGTLQWINIQGVYLPLLWDPTVCMKSPLPLVYSGGHFSALMVDTPSSLKEFFLPLVDYHGMQLVNKFALSMEDQTSLVMDYLNPIQKPCNSSPYVTTAHIVCARMTVAESPAYLKLLISGFIDACSDAYGPEADSKWNAGYSPPGREEVRDAGRRVDGGMNGETAAERVKCINHCGQYGVAEYSFMCHGCHQRYKDSMVEHQPEKQQYASHSSSHPRQSSRDQSAMQGGSGGGGGGGGVASLGTVKCPQCSDPGYPQLLGMCRRCYDNNNNMGPEKQNDPLYETLPGMAGQPALLENLDQIPPAFPIPRNPKERSKCRKHGCNFYGDQGKRFYCSRCFEANMESILKEVDDEVPLMPGGLVSFSPVSPEPPGHGPREYPSGSGNEPPKCHHCREFFANEDYAGLCNDCFMKSTMPGAPELPRNPANNGGGKRFTEPHPRMRDERSYSYDPTTSQAAYRDHSHFPTIQQSSPRVSSRMANPTAPVGLASQMGDMTLSDNCIRCLGGQLPLSSHYTICAKHLKELLPQEDRLDDRREVGDEVRSKPSASTLGRNDREPSQYSRNPSYQEVRPAYEGGDREPSQYSRNPSYQEVRPAYEGGDREPSQYSRNPSQGVRPAYEGGDGRVRQNAPVSPHGRHGSGGEDSRRHSSQHEQGLSPRREPQNYGNEQGYYDSPLYGNEQGYPQHQERYGNEQYQQGSKQQWRPQPNEERRYPQQQDYPPYSRQQQQNDLGRGRAEGGAVGVSVADREQAKPVLKALCASTGCSFKGYPDLKDLCPDCYKENYDPNFNSPDYPLV